MSLIKFLHKIPQKNNEIGGLQLDERAPSVECELHARSTHRDSPLVERTSSLNSGKNKSCVNHIFKVVSFSFSRIECICTSWNRRAYATNARGDRHASRACLFHVNKLNISWFLSRRCILRCRGVSFLAGRTSSESFSNTFAMAGLSLCSLGRSLNRTYKNAKRNEKMK